MGAVSAFSRRCGTSRVRIPVGTQFLGGQAATATAAVTTAFSARTTEHLERRNQKCGRNPESLSELGSGLFESALGDVLKGMRRGSAPFTADAT